MFLERNNFLKFQLSKKFGAKEEELGASSLSDLPNGSAHPGDDAIFDGGEKKF
jgi:hypothetical protein